MASTPLRRLCHWGPILVLGIIKLISWAMVHLIGMWWPPHGSLGGALHAAMFLGLAASTLYYFLQALLEGPGFVPLGWKPDKDDDREYLQFCTECNGYKAPRSHHCRKCGYCVKKMDHHCPWINCCVGHANHRHFVLFLLSAVLGCFHASVVGECVRIHTIGSGISVAYLLATFLLARFIKVLIICMYHAINRVWYIHHPGRYPLIYLTLPTLILTLLAIGMAVGVVLAVGALLYFQIRGILRNRTTIEDWIVEKAEARREDQGLPPFVFPYDLGKKNNFKLVLAGWKSNGLKWPIRNGCNEYDLTMEQQAQKADKRLRSRLYTAVSTYTGRWIPLLSRPRASCNAPCTDEARIPLQPGDVIRATRQRKHWLFGELIETSTNARGPRGWFPRDCVVPTDYLNKKPD